MERGTGGRGRANAEPLPRDLINSHSDAGDMLMSRMVNAAINNKQIYGVMKVVARQVMQNTAEKAGIPWRDIVRQYENTPEVHPMGFQPLIQSLPRYLTCKDPDLSWPDISVLLRGESAVINSGLILNVCRSPGPHPVTSPPSSMAWMCTSA
jgi:hypothetical protein